MISAKRRHPQRLARVSVLWAALCVLLAAGPAPAQPTSAQRAVALATSGDLDADLLLRMYHADGPFVASAMRAADWSAYPAFALVPGVAWGHALVTGSGYDTAYHATLAEGTALVGAAVLKRFYQRPRPHQVMPQVTARQNTLDRRITMGDSYSFPSGHATLSFALATSLSLSHPRWYVVAPSLTWAAAVALSRMWVGVHYPSDVLAGALLGGAAGAGVHLLRRAVTPTRLQRSERRVPPAVGVVVRW